MEDIQLEIKNIVSQLEHIEVEPTISRTDPEHGDFASNIALQIGGRVGKNPREIAALIQKRLESSASSILEKIEIAGPGFINFYLKSFLKSRRLFQWRS